MPEGVRPENDRGEELVEGKLWKYILKEGDGVSRAGEGDEVHVHYTGRLLDGTKFDSSVDRGDMFTFELGQGRVIKGWDVGVAAMTKGEKCILTCHPEYAYGARGSPPTIPPDAYLSFEVELFKWVSDNDLFEDGGCVREVISKGDGWEEADVDDECWVSVETRHAGTGAILGSSANADAGGEALKIGSGRSVGIEKALESTKKGGVFEITCTPQYAGTWPVASPPADANVIHKVTLHRWVRYKDLTGEGVGAVANGGVIYHVEAEAEDADYKKPNEGATCVVSYSVTPAEGAGAGATAEEVSEKSVVVEDGSLWWGIDMCLREMKAGYVSVVQLKKPYAPFDCTVKVTLHSFQQGKNEWDMSQDEKLEYGEKRKAEGNGFFKTQFNERAMSKYEAAIKLVKDVAYESAEDQARKRAILLGSHLNRALVAIKLTRWNDAVSAASEALALEPNNPKGLFRRGKASLMRGDFDDAERDLAAAAALTPDDAQVTKTLEYTRKKRVAQEKKEAAVYSKMFSG